MDEREAILIAIMRFTFNARRLWDLRIYLATKFSGCTKEVISKNKKNMYHIFGLL